MAYVIEILGIKPDLYPQIEKALEPLNKIQKDQEFIFRLPPERLRQHLHLNRRDKFITDEVFEWLRKYREEAKGNKTYVMAVVDGRLGSKRNPDANLFGGSSAVEGLAVFTVAGFDHFVNDMVRFIRYYLVRYAVSFVEPAIKSHDDPNRKECIFHLKLYKPELLDSLNTGHICPKCMDELRPKLSPELDSAIRDMLQAVSNQHPYFIVIKGGGAKGLAFVGALLELEQYFSFDGFAGTSAGAITAVLLGAGYKPSELEDIIKNKDFQDFKDAGLIKGIRNYLRTRGYYPGDTIEVWLSDLLKEKLPECLEEVAMRDLPHHTIIYASRIRTGTVRFDSKKEREEQYAAFATRCSMTIPYIFSPRTIDNVRVFDGGLCVNFPMEEVMKAYPQKPVIGLYLMSDVQRKAPQYCDIFNIAIDASEVPFVQQNLDKVVVIDPKPIGTMDFNLMEEDKKLLLQAGRLGALKFITRNFPDIAIDKQRMQGIATDVDALRVKAVARRS